jgi:hypothetical protein
MSTKHFTTTLAVVFALAALTATTAQARPYEHALTNGTTKASSSPTVPTIHGRLGGGHIVSSGAAIAPSAPVTLQKSVQPSDGLSTTTMIELAGLVLLAASLIAIWAAARSGRGIRQLTH